jgi:hypothetical protein
MARCDRSVIAPRVSNFPPGILQLAGRHRPPIALIAIVNTRAPEIIKEKLDACLLSIL